MRPARRALSLTALLLTMAASTAEADGAPSADEWPVERNAQVLKHREWKLGLWGFDGGILDRLQVGTVWWTWPIVSPNVHLKILLLDRSPYSLTFESSFFYIDLDRLGDLGIDQDLAGSASVWPVELHFDAWAHPRMLVGGSASYSFTHTSPAYDPQSFEGTGGYDSMFVSGHLTARATRRLWVVTEVDWLLYQGVGAAGSVDRQIDDFTHVAGQASAVASALSPASGGAITASLVVRHKRFGMRMGVGYGNWVTPRLRVVVPRAIPYATLDFFGRWGGTAREHSTEATTTTSSR